MKKTVQSLALCASFGAALHAVDYPVFYRTALFNGRPPVCTSDWATQADVHYGQGSTRSAYSEREKAVDLFNGQGAFVMTEFSTGLAVDDRTRVSADQATALNDFNTALNAAGPFSFGGKYSTRQFTLDLRQNVLWGLFVQAHLPLIEHHLSAIAVTGSNKADFTEGVSAALNALLNQFGIQPWSTGFKKAGVGDLGLYVGWQGHETIPNSIITSFNGDVQAGVVVPTGATRDLGRVFAMSLGNEGVWGTHVTARLEVGFFEYVAFGLTTGCLLFFPSSLDRRVKTATAQNGWINLVKTHVQVDQGTRWNIGAHLRASYEQLGLNAYAGVSYVTQEATRYNARPKDQPDTLPATLDNLVINSDTLLKRWYTINAHFMTEWDSGQCFETPVAPRLEVTYDMPLAGRYSWKTAMFGGALGARANWNW